MHDVEEQKVNGFEAISMEHGSFIPEDSGSITNLVCEYAVSLHAAGGLGNNGNWKPEGIVQGDTR